MFMSDFFAARRSGFGDRHSLVRVGLALCLVVLACFGGAIGRSQAAINAPGKLASTLVKDINQLTYPSNPDQLTPLGDTLYFVVDDGVHGRELWWTDGILTNTVLVKDIWPGVSTSAPEGLFGWSGKLYFFADDSVHGSELWVSDGTPDGTALVKDINPGPGSSSAMNSAYQPLNDSALNYAVLDNQLFFPAFSTQGFELWKTDGSSVGTVQVADIRAGGDGSFPHALATFKGQVYFVAIGDSQQGLWRSDGTTAGTGLFASMPLAVASQPNKLMAVGDQLFFISDDGTTGNELWRSDGTVSGTRIVKEILPGIASSIYSWGQFASISNTLYFLASDNIGSGLWKSDGTPTGTSLVKSIDVALLIAADQALYFVANGSVGGQKLMRSDGTPEGTVVVKDVGSNPAQVPITDIGVLSNTIFFAVQDGTLSNAQLWRSDGTTPNTNIVRNFPWNTRNNSNFPIANLTVLGDKLLLQANGELWQSDGTTIGTNIVRDIQAISYDSSPDNFLNDGKALYFAANNNAELWKSDGTLTGTQIITDIRPNYSSDSRPLRMISNTLLFAAVSPSVDTPSFNFCVPHQLFSTDGTLTNTNQLTDLPQGMGTLVHSSLLNCYYEVESSEVMGGHSFFGAGGEFWKTDGTVSGTSRVTTLTLPTVTSPRLINFVVISNTLFFQLGSGDSVPLGQSLPLPRQLWASDGTALGTHLVKDFPFGILEKGGALNGKLLVLAYSPEAGSPYGLWSSDGTTTGTIGLKALVRPEQLTVVGDHAFVADTESEASTALWRTDGTVTGTTKIAGLPLLVGRNWWLKSIGGRLYLRIKTPQLNGFIWDIWRLNDSENGFDLLWRGEDTGLSLPGLWQGRPVFVTSSGVWVIDEKQIRQIASLAIDPTFAIKSDLSNVIVGRDLFLSASDFMHGTELWRLSASATADTYIDAFATAPARPTSRAIVQTRYGNLGSTVATTVTLAATLDISLTYVSNSLNLTPTVNGNKLVWQLPGVSFLEEKPFDLILQTPNATLGTRYLVTMTVSSGTAEENPNNNVAQSVVVISALTYVPVVMR